MRILTCIISLLLFSSCRFMGVGERVSGNGNVITRDVQVGSFHSVEVSGDFVVKVRQSSEHSVQIMTDENLMEYIEVATADGSLIVKSRKGYNLNPSNELILLVAAQVFRNIDVSGASDIIGEGTISSSEPLEVNVSGSGKIVMELNLPAFTASISGDGDAELRGKVGDLAVDISGSGSVKGFELETENCRLNISGAGEAEVYAVKTLDAKISGAGDVEYRGNPQVTRSISGAGSIEKVN